ncbi:SDR family NAD(P)-dependent oxidoreductase [Chryseobacterium arthrosphaerae]|uniref:SDR family NAD(P)-dependent oxidoreductase n=1 Tax=Chryseobacterium arthrosphaerae TaxID=651561 RepID=UPI001E2F9826|nr:SDR family oxidoreductase [Chryseobacterium arthrosphaerae]UEQ77311.1 SDR family oxidoreductase [Chryseobacterium arthrosphaerae]
MERKNQYALITGATSGIGYELARQFAKNGYDLVIVARDHEELNRKAEEFKGYGVNVISISKNLFLQEEVYSLYSELKMNGISPEILVNDAGQGVFGKFQETDIHREVDIVQLNIIAVIILTKLFLKDRLPKGSGKILNLASVASKVPGPWHSVYHGTKAFVLSWSEAIREELKDSGITVTALLPGPTDTDFFNKADMNRSKILEDRDTLASPEEVAVDGYNALMNDDDKIISGLKNKLSVAMANLSSDSMAAHRMAEMQKPVTEK